jgi:hypothetical protein
MPDAFLPSVIWASDRGGFETEEEAAYLALQLIIGAADTVCGLAQICHQNCIILTDTAITSQSQISTWSFLEAMLQFPDVQRKARAEIGACSIISGNNTSGSYLLT